MNSRLKYIAVVLLAGYVVSKTKFLQNLLGLINEDDRSDNRKGVPYEERTKKDLYKLAQERDIEGRSLMNKEELIEVLREQ